MSSVAHDVGLVSEAAGPVIFWAQRLSSLVFGTAILLVWRSAAGGRAGPVHGDVAHRWHVVGGDQYIVMLVVI